jgi:hypothetical protein
MEWLMEESNVGLSSKKNLEVTKMQTFYLYYSSRAHDGKVLNPWTVKVFNEMQKRMGWIKYQYINNLMA